MDNLLCADYTIYFNNSNLLIAQLLAIVFLPKFIDILHLFENVDYVYHVMLFS